MILRISDEPRALAQIFEKAEASLASKLHPDPYIRESPRLCHITSSKARPSLQLSLRQEERNGAY
jgi:hypothetical protein